MGWVIVCLIILYFAYGGAFVRQMDRGDLHDPESQTYPKKGEFRNEFLADDDMPPLVTIALLVSLWPMLRYMIWKDENRR